MRKARTPELPPQEALAIVWHKEAYCDPGLGVDPDCSRSPEDKRLPPVERPPVGKDLESCEPGITEATARKGRPPVHAVGIAGPLQEATF